MKSIKVIVDYDDSKLESLNELIKSIDMGMDIEFYYKDKRYNISQRDYKVFICLCPDGNACFYENSNDLLYNHRLEGKVIADIWQDLIIEAM